MPQISFHLHQISVTIFLASYGIHMCVDLVEVDVEWSMGMKGKRIGIVIMKIFINQ